MNCRANPYATLRRSLEYRVAGLFIRHAQVAPRAARHLLEGK